MEEHSIKQLAKEIVFTVMGSIDEIELEDWYKKEIEIAGSILSEFIETNFIPRSKVEEAIGDDELIDIDYPVDMKIDLAINEFRSHLRTQLLEREK